MQRRNLFRSKRKQRTLRWSIVLLCLIVLFSFMLMRCRPILTTFSESQAVWTATKMANHTVAMILEQYADMCREMVRVSYNETGSLVSVMPDTASINTVRTAITESAMTEMEHLTALSVSIPFGTMIGSDWLSGWGPMVTLPISFTATVLSDVSSSLEAVGINQTAYRVLVHLEILLCVITPGGRSSVGTEVSYPMAEAILLGEVPDNLTEVYGDDQTLLGKIFDYGTAE